MSGLRVGVDLDGVVYDFADSLRRYLVEWHGITDLPDPDRWEIWECWGMSMEVWLDHFEAGVAAGEVFRTGFPLPGAKEALDALRSAGHTLHIVTHRDIHPRAIQSTSEWLAEHEIPYDTITFSRSKTVVPVDIFIEDNVDNALAIWDAGGHPVIFDRPWNQRGALFDRVSTWSGFTEMVSTLAALR